MIGTQSQSNNIGHHSLPEIPIVINHVLPFLLPSTTDFDTYEYDDTWAFEQPSLQEDVHIGLINSTIEGQANEPIRNTILSTAIPFINGIVFLLGTRVVSLGTGTAAVLGCERSGHRREILNL